MTWGDVNIDVAFGLYDADWYLANSRGEFLTTREVEDHGELGVYHAPIPATTVELSVVDPES